MALGLDGLCSCDGEKIATTDPMHIGILTTTHAWGSRRYCRYIRHKSNRVSSKFILTRLTIVIDLECQFFVVSIVIV